MEWYEHITSWITMIFSCYWFGCIIKPDKIPLSTMKSQKYTTQIRSQGETSHVKCLLGEEEDLNLWHRTSKFLAMTGSGDAISKYFFQKPYISMQLMIMTTILNIYHHCIITLMYHRTQLGCPHLFWLHSWCPPIRIVIQ